MFADLPLNAADEEARIRYNPIRHLRLECYLDTDDGIVVLSTPNVSEFTDVPASQQTVEHLRNVLRYYDIEIPFADGEFDRTAL